MKHIAALFSWNQFSSTTTVEQCQQERVYICVVESRRVRDRDKEKKDSEEKRDGNGALVQVLSFFWILYIHQYSTMIYIYTYITHAHTRKKPCDTATQRRAHVS